jgi:hypothetical protein
MSWLDNLMRIMAGMAHRQKGRVIRENSKGSAGKEDKGLNQKSRSARQPNNIFSLTFFSFQFIVTQTDMPLPPIFARF